MYRSQIIRRLSASAMLLLFAISIVPRHLLHDVITGHKHIYSKSGNPVNIQSTKNNFQCNWQDPVVESPFTDQLAFQLLSPLIFFTTCNHQYTQSYHSTKLFLSVLRGPPSEA